MSTYWYLECGSHDPPLRSDSEISQHTDALLDLARELWADRERISAAEDSWELIRQMFPTSGALSSRDVADRDYFGPHAVPFIRAHPRCDVRLVSEYGDTEPIELSP